MQNYQTDSRIIKVYNGTQYDIAIGDFSKAVQRQERSDMGENKILYQRDTMLEAKHNDMYPVIIGNVKRNE